MADYANSSLNLCSVNVTCLAAVVNVYGVKSDYVLYEVTEDGLDTAEVWGSSPHAPTKSFNALGAWPCDIYQHRAG